MQYGGHQVRVWLVSDALVGGRRMQAGEEAVVDTLEAQRLHAAGLVYIPDQFDAKMMLSSGIVGGYETK